MIAEYGFVRVAAAVPTVRAGAVAENVDSMIALASEAEETNCDLAVFPELCVSGYTCADLFQQRRMLSAAEEGLSDFMKGSAATHSVLVVGMPIAQDGLLFNCGVVIQAGRILGVVPKTFIPGHKEYYEPRWFASSSVNSAQTVRLCGHTVPFGTDLLFRDRNCPACCFGVELCEDLWAPVPPSSRMTLAGATIIANLSASSEEVGKAGYRRQLVRQQSATCLAAYVYCGSGVGESTTDLVFAGDALIAENGKILARGDRFGRDPSIVFADVDVDFLEHERLTNITYRQAVRREDDSVSGSPASGMCRRIVDFEAVTSTLTLSPLRRPVQDKPFVPGDRETRNEQCEEIFAIQSTGLATRMLHAGIEKAVIGLSGGLDSTLALLVTREAFNRVELPSEGIVGITMPGFGTSDRTLDNVKALCDSLSISLETIDIAESCRQHFKDIGHDIAAHDVVYENVQARERTQILMDRANQLGALVVGTGDMSELALGWCTYNGDHMSMYAVNAGVPKTLVRYLIEHVAADKLDTGTASVLRDVLTTPISPELLPPDSEGEIAQRTEDLIGPYELHDFFLYYAIRCGFSPGKVLMLAKHAYGSDYSETELGKWLTEFLTRFFQQQFKRSCMPDGPKVGTISLSPRGDWRMPSDASPDEWLAEL